jgi:DNA-binding NarL/FixJ family response regulator
MHDEYLYTDRALRAGAQGYINKQEATEKIVEAIRQVLGGKIYLSGHMAERMLHHMVGLGQTTPAQASIDSLSNRELEVFEMIGKGNATRQIAENLHLSVKTIESHRENIKKKLMLQTNQELVRRSVQWVLEQGK